MGIFNSHSWPYTNIHEMNLDWVIAQIKRLKDSVERIDERRFGKSYVNVAFFAEDEKLDSNNIACCIKKALDESSYIYIPAGTYYMNVVINRDCHILLDEKCYIATPNGDPAIKAIDCSISITGGNIFAGENDGSRTPVGGIPYTTKGIVELKNCYECKFENINVPHSKYSSVFQVEDSESVIFENINMSNILLCGIRFLHGGRDLIVRNCRFENITKIDSADFDYCYAVSTGLRSLNLTGITPPDGIIYENNYVKNSEDCALDTHGAQNVIIRNNKIEDTVNAITAYNDNLRVERPEGWTMKNVLIENNYCDSDRDNDTGRRYPHSFIFLGASKGISNPEDAGRYDAYVNCIVRNNYFRSANTKDGGIIFLNSMSRNVSIENNVIDCQGTNRPTRFAQSLNFSFRNNQVVNSGGYVLAVTSSGVYENNTGARVTVASSGPSYVKYVRGGLWEGNSSLLEGGDLYLNGSSELDICTNVYGLRAVPNVTLTGHIIVDDGIATVDVPTLIPDMALHITELDANYYVKDMIDAYTCYIRTASDEPLADGYYSFSLREATLKPL